MPALFLSRMEGESGILEIADNETKEVFLERYLE